MSSRNTSAAAPTMQEVGESVYARVAADARVPSGEMAGKITGMVMAAGFGMEVLVPLMTDDAALGVKVAWHKSTRSALSWPPLRPWNALPPKGTW